MSKTFSQIEKGDKIYVISIQNSRFEHEPGEPIMKTALASSCSKSSGWYTKTMSISIDDRRVFYPEPTEQAHVFNNSVDTTGYKKVNSTVFATNKRSCIEKAISLIKNSDQEQKEVIERMSENIDNNKKMIEILEKGLEMADFPDTVEEFAEMALA